MRYLGKEPEFWNRLKEFDGPFSHVERSVRRKLEREWLPSLSRYPSDLAVLTFIISRTLGWQKFFEAITIDHFRYGIGDEGDPLISNGAPVSLGTGIKKEDTIRASLKRLSAANQITVISGHRGTKTPANIYMAGSREMIGRMLVDGGCPILPWTVPRIIVGEHLYHDGAIWKVLAAQGGEAECVKMEHGRATRSRKILTTENCGRPSFQMWEAYEVGDPLK